MKSIDTKYLPVTVADFEELREYNKIYVDKTDLIYEFARDSYPCFLSRPRRFGKSLLLSTLKSLFEHGLEYFNGLKIKELWEDKTYPVLYLDFLHFSKNDFQQFKKDLYKDLKKFAIENNVKVDPDEKNNPLSLFDDICSDMNKKFVLLIDEYDTQLSNNIDKQEKFEEFQEFLYDFFTKTKSYLKKFRFVFITGVSRFSNTSIFSGINNLIDLSLKPYYGSLVGFTDKELDFYFSDYLENAAKVLEKSVENLRIELKDYYYGYCFDPNLKIHVYNPWSILNFLADPESKIIPYWSDSGFSSLVVNYFASYHKNPNAKHQFNPFLDCYEIERAKLISSSNVKELKVEAFLYHAGYLTIKDVNASIYTLTTPNIEIRSYLSKSFIDDVLVAKNLIQKNYFDTAFYREICASLTQVNEDNIMSSFNKILNYIGYDAKIFYDEASVRDVICIVLDKYDFAPIKFADKITGSNILTINREDPSAKGRSDIKFYFNNTTYVFELKVARDGDNEEKLLESAVNQIKDRDYANDFIYTKLIRFALVENANKKSFTRCKVIEG